MGRRGRARAKNQPPPSWWRDHSWIAALAALITAITGVVGLALGRSTDTTTSAATGAAASTDLASTSTSTGSSSSSSSTTTPGDVTSPPGPPTTPPGDSTTTAPTSGGDDLADVIGDTDESGDDLLSEVSIASEADRLVATGRAASGVASVYVLVSTPDTTGETVVIPAMLDAEKRFRGEVRISDLPMAHQVRHSIRVAARLRRDTTTTTAMTSTSDVVTSPATTTEPDSTCVTDTNHERVCFDEVIDGGSPP